MSKSEAHERVENEWKDKAAAAVEAERIRRGIKEKGLFAQAIGIRPDTYRRISNGDGIADAINYAILFHATGLPEVDPRTLPPRFYKTPQGEDAYSDRKWSDTQWELWKAPQRAPRLPKDSAPPVSSSPKVDRPQPMPTPHVATPGLSTTLNNLLAAFILEIATAVADENDRRSGASNQPLQPAALIKLFRQFLESYAYGTVEMRDQLLAQHGTALAQILILLDPLSSPDRAERERNLDLARRVN